MPQLSVDRHAAYALVTLQRPEKRNALSIELRFELARAFEELSADDAIACAVLTGAGTAFCSGMDTTQFGGDRENKQRLFDSSVAAFGAVGRCPKPVVAAVNGPAIAGGFVLALLCDVRLASTSARFGFAELPRGIPPSYAAARAALPAALARELALTGRVIDAEEALRRGVVSELCPPDALSTRALEVAAVIAAAPGAGAETKRRILLERERCWGALFDAEERALRDALLSGE